MVNKVENKVPLVSIITVTYNSEKTIGKTIDSVFDQTYKNIEYIIIDGESSDRTIDIVKRYKKKFGDRLIFVSEKDNGIYDAMNKGIEKSSGEIIGIINSDDWYESDAVEKVLESLTMKGIDGVYHGYQRFVSIKGEEILISRSSKNNLRNKMLEHPSCFVSRNIYIKQGMFNLDYKFCADYDFLLRLLENNVPFIEVDSIISNFTVGGVSSTPKAALESLKMKRDRGLVTYRKYLIKKLQMQFTDTLKRIFSYS
ncbi:glycosyltransferase [Bacillus sp. Y1]|nr:glycosyltransferase family 2 protein [Bacillus sp. Y1]AYA78083.1 glycosyltransferase [Bacillus sp. Y1]